MLQHSKKRTYSRSWRFRSATSRRPQGLQLTPRSHTWPDAPRYPDCRRQLRDRNHIGTSDEGASAKPARTPNYERTSSVMTSKFANLDGPKLVDSATSVASRPRAMRMRPMRGLLWRASNVYQLPSK